MTQQPATPDLSQAQAGEAAFSRAIHRFSDADLRQPSLLPGWDRAALITHVASNAQAFTRAIGAAVAGSDNTRMYSSREERDAQIAEGARRDAEAIRADADDSAEALAAAWSNLTPEQWSLRFTNGQGKQTPLVGTVKARAREVWVHLVDLGGEDTFAAVPSEVAEAVLREVWGSWTSRDAAVGLAISTEASDGASLTLGTPEDDGVVLVSGSLADVTGWATGRLRTGVAATRAGEPAELPQAPDWI